MIEIQADDPERSLITFVRQWLKFIAAGSWQEACAMIDEPNCYGIVWTPDQIQQVVEDTFRLASHFRRDHPEGIRWTDPDELGDGGCPNINTWNDGCGYSFEYTVPLNGEWSDLTAQFQFLRRQQGFAVVLHDLHVM